MLDVKKLLTKILLRFNNYTKVAETQTFTALNKSWKFRRIGNVVYVDASADANGSIPAGTSSIGTLPASMRPESNVYLKCTNNNADWRLYITPSGAVTFYHPTATSGAVNCGFSGYSFIVGGGYCITSLLSTLAGGWRYVRCEEIARQNNAETKDSKRANNITGASVFSESHIKLVVASDAHRHPVSELYFSPKKLLQHHVEWCKHWRCCVPYRVKCSCRSSASYGQGGGYYCGKWINKQLLPVIQVCADYLGLTIERGCMAC